MHISRWGPGEAMLTMRALALWEAKDCTVRKKNAGLNPGSDAQALKMAISRPHL